VISTYTNKYKERDLFEKSSFEVIIGGFRNQWNPDEDELNEVVNFGEAIATILINKMKMPFRLRST